jgi:hypothetical protein
MMLGYSYGWGDRSWSKYVLQMIELAGRDGLRKAGNGFQG